MIISIDTENRLIGDKQVSCYIPKINDVPVMGTGYIIKESVNLEGNKTDNIDIAKSILNEKIKEINKFLESNGHLFGESFEVLIKNGKALKIFKESKWWDDKYENWCHPSWKPSKVKFNNPTNNI